MVGADVACDELRALLRDSARSKASHPRSEARLLALANSTEGRILVAQDVHGSLYEHLRRVFVAKKRDGALERVMHFVGRVAPKLEALVAGWTSETLRLCLKACHAGDANTRLRGTELAAHLLDGVQDDVDEDVYDTLVDVFIERLGHERTSAARAAACAALKRLQQEDDEHDRASATIRAACEGDPSAEVRKAAVNALEPCSSTLDIVVRRCRDVDAGVRQTAFDCLRNKVHPTHSTRCWASLLHPGLKDRDHAVRLAAALTAAKWCAALGVDNATLASDDDYAAVKAAVAAAHACAAVLAGEQPPANSVIRSEHRELLERMIPASLDDFLLSRSQPRTKHAARVLMEIEIDAGGSRLSPAELDDALRRAFILGETLEEVHDFELAILAVRAKLVDEARRRRLYQLAVDSSDPYCGARLARACMEDDLDTVLNDAIANIADEDRRLRFATEACATRGVVTEQTLAAAEREIWLPAVSKPETQARVLGIIGLGRRLCLSKNWSLAPLLWRVASNVSEDATARAYAVKALADAALTNQPPHLDFWHLLRRLVRDDDDCASVAAAEAAAKLVIRFGGRDDTVVDLVLDLAFVAFRAADDRLKQVLAVFVGACRAKHPDTISACASMLPGRLASDDVWFADADPRQVVALFAPGAPFDLAYALCHHLLAHGPNDEFCACFSVIPPPPSDDVPSRSLLAVLATRVAGAQSRRSARAPLAFAAACGGVVNLGEDAHQLDTSGLLDRFLDAPATKKLRAAAAKGAFYRDDEDDDSYFSRLRAAKAAADKKTVSQGKRGDENADVVCAKCAKGDHPERLLLCDSCPRGFHLDCLEPALDAVPDGDWFCPVCQDEKVE